MKSYEVAAWLNSSDVNISSDREFAEVFALMGHAMNGRGLPHEWDYDAEVLIKNANYDHVCERLKVILKDIQTMITGNEKISKYEEEKKILKMPKGLRLFYVNWDDEDEGGNHKEFVVGKTYDSAFKRWYKKACGSYYSFTYLFDEVTEEELIDEFIRYHCGDNGENINTEIKAGIYDAEHIMDF